MFWVFLVFVPRFLIVLLKGFRVLIVEIFGLDYLTLSAVFMCVLCVVWVR